MPDNKRLDLNADLERMTSELLKDVEAATKEVKTRKAADAAKDRRNAIKEKDRKTQMIIIAIAAVVLLAVGIWFTFGRQSGTAVNSAGPVPQQDTKINVSTDTKKNTAATTSKIPTRPASPAQHSAQQGSNDQPYDDAAPGQ